MRVLTGAFRMSPIFLYNEVERRKMPPMPHGKPDIDMGSGHAKRLI